MAELAENEPLYGFFLINKKNTKLKNPVLLCLALGKKKMEI